MIDQYVLYLDRFRGFEDTYIPLTDVSFLVGENSSGKTSILKILKLMASREFLVQNDFGGEDTGLNTASDIISTNSRSGRFRIGMIRREIFDDGPGMPLGALVGYKIHDGMPFDTHFTCTLGSQEVAIKRVDGHVYVRTRKKIKLQTDVRSLFPSWITEQESDSLDGYSLLAIPEELRQEPLFYALSIVAQRLKFAQFGRLPSTLFDDRLVWLDPIRTKPRRTYDQPRRGYSPVGDHTPYLIRRVLSSNQEHNKRILQAVSKVGQESGLFKAVATQHLGRSAAAPFQLQIVLERKSFNVTNVGYGVSQALPGLLEVICRAQGSWFAIQQPEVHLHPRAQAALGDFIADFACADSKKFLIETHSDYMINRYRAKLSRSKVKPSSQILFFERKNGKNTVTPLEISDTGELPVDQPRGYRSFFIKEQMDMLEL
ncbi:MAG: AAA family ATPase [Fimbriimonadaceae bacterium]